LDTEGDAWYLRNKEVLAKRDFDEKDPVINAVSYISEHDSAPLKVLEIGCGDGTRMTWIHEKHGYEVYGLDPSALAVEAAIDAGVQAVKGTADKLPFDNDFFDIVVFGCCLYLCDRADLFNISSEANRVLKDHSWLVIQDFYSAMPMKREYHHFEGMYSFKMDYKQLFTWHPWFTCVVENISEYKTNHYGDNKSDHVSLTILRKYKD